MAGPPELGRDSEPTAIRPRPIDGAPDPLVGTRLGEFVVGPRLGEGGMGVVYRGEQPALGRPVAIKVLKHGAAQGGTTPLLDEARTVGAIRHPAIVEVFSVGALPDGRQYLVMELLEGEPLNVLLGRRLRLTPMETLLILDQVLQALEAAHAVGVIHRDLKPENLSVQQLRDGGVRVKLLDFGLAKQAALGEDEVEQTNVNVAKGTPEFMAPEQARGKAVSARSDLYALGVVAFELLTGEVPFPADTDTAVMRRQIRDVAAAPSTLAPSVPPKVDAFVLRLLAKAPKDRPPSATEARREVLRLIRSQQEAQTALRPRPLEALPAKPGQGQPAAALPGQAPLAEPRAPGPQTEPEMPATGAAAQTPGPRTEPQTPGPRTEPEMPATEAAAQTPGPRTRPQTPGPQPEPRARERERRAEPSAGLPARPAARAGVDRRPQWVAAALCALLGGAVGAVAWWLARH